MAESASCCAVGAVAVLLSAVPPVAELPAVSVLPAVPVAAVPVLPVVDVPLPAVAVCRRPPRSESAPACCNELYKPLGVYTDTPDPPPSEATIADCDDKLVAIDDKEAADVFGTTSGVGW